MNLGKYIHELLLENDTVIVPDFGAFTSIYKSSEIDKETNELKPPSKVIGFNSQIKNNDGLLVGKIAEERGISTLNALKEIEKERENIIFYLDKIGRTTLEDTGELFYDENNEIQFNPTEDENLLLESYGLEPVSINDTFRQAEEKEESAIQEEKISNDKEEPDPELKKAISGLLVDVETQSPEIIIPETFNEDKEPLEDEKTEDEEAEKVSLYSLSEEYEKKKKRRWLWLLVLLIPIIAVAVYFIKNKKTDKFVDPYKQYEESINVDIEEPSKQPDLDPLSNDSNVKSKPDSVIQPELDTESKQEEVINAPITPKYYLISGSFKEEKNAQEYFNKLKSEGLDPIKLGKNGSYYIIGLGAYDTSWEAIEAKKEFESQNSKPGIWILKK